MPIQQQPQSNQDKLVELYKSGIDHASELAAILGISREWAYKLAERANVKLDIREPARPHYCIDCSKNIGSKTSKRCKECHLKYTRANPDYKGFRKITCSVCQTVKAIRAAEYEHRLKNRKIQEWFCSKKCYGKFIGSTKGWGEYQRRIVLGVQSSTTSP